MVLVELAQAVPFDFVANTAGAVLAEETPTDINTSGVLSFFATKIAPILLAVLGIIFMGRASKGEVSKVLTSSAIAVVGMVFVAGATTLFFFGEYLIKLLFK
ncbi:MAG: hypothetical protein H0T78_04000 [Longispora sp.]|nr:hypothetical protein [Longispora sp. (in: high G+C Gram-positive bacteria)]